MTTGFLPVPVPVSLSYSYSDSHASLSHQVHEHEASWSQASQPVQPHRFGTSMSTSSTLAGMGCRMSVYAQVLALQAVDSCKDENANASAKANADGGGGGNLNASANANANAHVKSKRPSSQLCGFCCTIRQSSLTSWRLCSLLSVSLSLSLSLYLSLSLNLWQDSCFIGRSR